MVSAAAPQDGLGIDPDVLVDETTLSRREAQVYAHKTEGRSHAEVAVELGISESAVGEYVRRIKGRLERAETTLRRIDAKALNGTSRPERIESILLDSNQIDELQLGNLAIVEAEDRTIWLASQAQKGMIDALVENDALPVDADAARERTTIRASSAGKVLDED